MRKPELIETSAISPCPFCGNTKLKVDSKHNGHWSTVGTHSATVRCSKCHARGPTASCKVSPELYGADEATKLKAIELWNKRI
jgi:Lar family restriction alleviation protein